MTSYPGNGERKMETMTGRERERAAMRTYPITMRAGGHTRASARRTSTITRTRSTRMITISGDMMTMRISRRGRS